MVVIAALGTLQTLGSLHRWSGAVVKDTSTGAVMRYILTSLYEQAEMNFPLEYRAYVLVWLMSQGIGSRKRLESLCT
jgi:hypothetical protein